jgi:hypothetical protein
MCSLSRVKTNKRVKLTKHNSSEFNVEVCNECSQTSAPLLVSWHAKDNFTFSLSQYIGFSPHHTITKNSLHFHKKAMKIRNKLFILS